MSVAYNTPITFGQWKTLVELANTKLPLPNAINPAPLWIDLWRTRFPWPPTFIVSSAEAMTHLHQADWGERPGGIAIIASPTEARQLTGADYRDAASWTLCPTIRVAADGTIGNAVATSEPDGTPGVVPTGPAKGFYWAYNGNWNWIGENLRKHNLGIRSWMRAALDPHRVEHPPVKGRYVVVGGEYFALRTAPFGTDGFEATRSPFSGLASAPHGEEPLIGAKFRQIDFYSPSSAPIVDLTGSLGIDRAYDTSVSTIRKLAIKIDGHPMQANGLACSLAVTATGPPPFTLTVAPPNPGITGIARYSGGTIGFVDIYFNAASLAGETDITVSVSAGAFWDPIGVLGTSLPLTRRFEGASPAADDEAIAGSATYKLVVDHETIAPRWYVKSKTSPTPLIYIPVPGGWPSAVWLESGIPKYTPQTPGTFLARPWCPGNRNFDPVYYSVAADRQVSFVADHARRRKTWSAGGSVRQAASVEFVVPRVFFRRSTNTPNSVPLEQFGEPGSLGLTPGCMIYDVHIRRKCTMPSNGGTPNILPEHWEAVPFRIGYMRGGTMIPLGGGEGSIPANEWSATLKVEWLNLGSTSLVYEADEDLDLQARIQELDSYSSGFGTQGTTNFGDYNSLEAACGSI